MSITAKKHDNGTIQKRFDLLVTGKLRKKTSIIEAMKIQDIIREKVGAWRGAEEIRKWRDRR